MPPALTRIVALRGIPARAGQGSSSNWFGQMPSEVHVGRNEGSNPLVIYTLYVLPTGTPNSAIRIDQPQPAGCPDVH